MEIVAYLIQLTTPLLCKCMWPQTCHCWTSFFQKTWVKLCCSFVLWCRYLKAFSVILNFSVDSSLRSWRRNRAANLHGETKSGSICRVWYTAHVYSLWIQATLQGIGEKCVIWEKVQGGILSKIRHSQRVCKRTAQQPSSWSIGKCWLRLLALYTILASVQGQGEKRTPYTISHLNATITWENLIFHT